MKIILSIMVFLGCSVVFLGCSSSINGNESSNIKNCHDFEKHVKKKYLKPHEGMCLLERGFNQDTDRMLEDIAFIFPVLDKKGRPCEQKGCPVFVTLTWDKDASVGVIVSKEVFKNKGFSGNELEPTLTYIREKTGVNFRRKN